MMYDLDNLIKQKATSCFTSMTHLQIFDIELLIGMKDVVIHAIICHLCDNVSGY